jgi:hypothetical protein
MTMILGWGYYRTTLIEQSVPTPTKGLHHQPHRYCCCYYYYLEEEEPEEEVDHHRRRRP